jgi:hypothetical protein
MLKRLVLVAGMLALVASAALAAGTAAKVIAVEQNKVRVVVAGARAPWMKKGAPILLQDGKGTITGVVADTLTLTTAKTPAVKPGDDVTLKPGRKTSSGC